MEKFDEIWLPLSGRFYRVAYHLLESEQDAEDAVQELYLKLWSGREDMVRILNPVAFGTAMLKNICIDRIRKRMVRQTEALDTAVSRKEAPPDGAVEHKETLRYLLAEMEKLPQRQRDILRMRAIDGLEYGEIARRTGLSEVHVRVLLSMARKTLRKRMKQ